MVRRGDELVYCRKNRGDPELAPCAVMVSMEGDLNLLRERLGASNKAVARLFSSRLYRVIHEGMNVSLVGPLLGAPYAVMILEKLRVLGVQKVIFLGWCGSVVPEIHIGDVVLPDRGVIGEGTSGYYLRRRFSLPSLEITERIGSCAARCSLAVHKGPVWSTDAPYRETADRVISLQQEGVLGVDMEVSALFSAGEFRGVSVGALLVVSDELGALKWVPGFSGHGLKEARRRVARIVEEICQKMM